MHHRCFRQRSSSRQFISWNVIVIVSWKINDYDLKLRYCIRTVWWYVLLFLLEILIRLQIEYHDIRTLSYVDTEDTDILSLRNQWAHNRTGNWIFGFFPFWILPNSQLPPSGTGKFSKFLKCTAASMAKTCPSIHMYPHLISLAFIWNKCYDITKKKMPPNGQHTSRMKWRNRT